MVFPLATSWAFIEKENALDLQRVSNIIVCLASDTICLINYIVSLKSNQEYLRHTAAIRENSLRKEFQTTLGYKV